MKINTLGYSIKQGLSSIRRNLLFSLASVGTIIACLFLFGVFYSVVLNMKSEINDVEDSLTISVFFDEDLSEQEIQNLAPEIAEVGNIASVTFVSGEDAWKSYIEDVYNGDYEYVNSVFGDDNPLESCASFDVVLRNVGKQKKTVSKIEKIQGVRKVNSSDDTAQSLDSLNKLVSYASVAIILILLFVSLFLISNTITIGITVRKEEIAIMKLIGAKDMFVRAPFLVEGVIIGLVGSIIPIGMVYVLYSSMVNYLTEHFSVVTNLITFVPVKEVFVGLIPISILIGVGVGFLGSLVTTHKHLKV